jgi:alpha-D-ribose 1-methylphosphonate 5-triphosphate synthase subunit PhnH
MDAMARPGQIKAIESALAPPRPLSPAAAAIALTLLDYETPVWLDSPLADAPDVLRWLKFYTGASVTNEKATAGFAIIADPVGMPRLDEFALGTLEFPDRSSTLLIQVDTFASGKNFVLTGPGIANEQRLSVTPMPDGIVAQLTANRRLFPRGVDIVLAASRSVAALPRSVRILGEE